MDKILEKLNKLSLPAVILVISLIWGGFFLANQLVKERKLDTCMDNVRERFYDRWNKECRIRGELTSDCRLPTEKANWFEKALRYDRAECLKRYPQN